MGGMFKSTEPAQFSFTVPHRIATALGGGFVAFSQVSTNADWLYSLIDDAGSTISFGAISTLPAAGVTAVAFGQICILNVDPSVFHGSGGLWTMILQNTNTPTEFPLTSDSCQWGGIVDLLAAGATKANNLPDNGTLSDLTSRVNDAGASAMLAAIILGANPPDGTQLYRSFNAADGTLYITSIAPYGQPGAVVFFGIQNFTDLAQTAIAPSMDVAISSILPVP